MSAVVALPPPPPQPPTVRAARVVRMQNVRVMIGPAG
jgi:hypothetical protein